MDVIRERQAEWEAKGATLIAQDLSKPALSDAIEEHAAALLNDWWSLCDELVGPSNYWFQLMTKLYHWHAQR